MWLIALVHVQTEINVKKVFFAQSCIKSSPHNAMCQPNVQLSIKYLH